MTTINTKINEAYQGINLTKFAINDDELAPLHGYTAKDTKEGLPDREVKQKRLPPPRSSLSYF